MPFSYFGDPNGEQARERIRELNQIITKPGIKIEVSHNFLSDEEIIKWLNSNTVNCYFYDYLEGSGIASSPDYAIAANKPIAVNNSRMFLNLHDLNPPIEIEKTCLKDIIKNGTVPLIPIYKKYKQTNVLKDYENICDILLQPHGCHKSKQGIKYNDTISDLVMSKEYASDCTNVLFLTHKIQNCGVYQYGKRLFEILEKTEGINYIYREIDSEQEYQTALIETPLVNAIIYNYHASTMNWLNESNIQHVVTNIGIPHESSYHLFDIIFDIDPSAVESPSLVSLPRPIYENIDSIIESNCISSDTVKELINYREPDVPIFGSFGFGFENKGFHNIVKMVNEQYDSAIIKFVIPMAHFDPTPNAERIRQLCFANNVKPGIKVIITHEFLSTPDILAFLKSTDLNIFLYDKMNGRGISSVIDYAISAKTPFAISDSYMFRNVYSDDICLYKNTIHSCMESSKSYINILFEKNKNIHLINKCKNILLSIK